MLTLVIFVVLVGLVMLGVPIFAAMGLTAAGTFILLGEGFVLPMMAQRMYVATTGFTLLAIPFFILAGNLMNFGGITHRVFDFARALAEAGWDAPPDTWDEFVQAAIDCTIYDDNGNITQAGYYIFRTYPSDILEGTAMANFARDLGVESALVAPGVMRHVRRGAAHVEADHVAETLGLGRLHHADHTASRAGGFSARTEARSRGSARAETDRP